MPRLVLMDDDGSTLFAGDVSQKNVTIIARFLQRNMGTLRAVADVKRTFDQLFKLGDVLGDKLLADKRRPPASPRARGGGRRR